MRWLNASDYFYTKIICRRNFQLFGHQRCTVCASCMHAHKHAKYIRIAEIPVKNAILIEYLWYLFSVWFHFVSQKTHPFNDRINASAFYLGRMQFILITEQRIKKKQQQQQHTQVINVKGQHSFNFLAWTLSRSVFTPYSSHKN